MSNAELENSSLELYETAYKLHYIDGNIPEACRIYKVIIDEFPNSNECGYAVIQLQKIQANEVSEKINTGVFPSLLIFILAAVTVVCLIVTTVALVSLKKVHSELTTLSLVSQALSIMYGGSDNDALEILGRAKTLSQGKISAPYLLSANIYMNSQQYARARAEFDTYQKISGETDSVFKKMVTVKIDRNEKTVSTQKTDSTHGTALQPASAAEYPAATFKPTIAERAAAAPQTVRQKPKIEKSRPVRPVRKGAAGSNPDSVSFF